MERRQIVELEKHLLLQAFVVRKKSIVELESDMLNGQKLQGPETAAEVIKTDFSLF